MAEQLNKQQREAVAHKDGPILVIAGAGTGKTRVITERIAHILKNKWCKNDEVLGLTFTEKAANEMEGRLDRLMELGYEAVQLSTFHSFCEKLLRQYGIDIGLSPNFRIIEGVKHWQFMKERLFEFELDYYRPLGNPTGFIDSLISHFGRLKEEIISPGDYLAAAKKKQKAAKTDEEKTEAKRVMELAKSYSLYQKLLADAGYLDFADLHFKVIELFKTRPNILAHLQGHYQYVLVDEYQDTNIAQNAIVDFLVAKHHNIMAVGDDDQSIYKFRGAAISNILQFEEKYPELKKVVLTENYRSNQAILDFAYASIQKNNPDRLEVKSKVNKKLTAQRAGNPETITLIHFPTVDQEVEFIVSEIKKTTEPLNETAILVRANAYARPVLDALRRENIPYQFLSERGLYNKEEVRDLIAVLRAVANPTDSTSLYRVLRMGYFHIPMETVTELMAAVKADFKSLWNHIKSSEACKKAADLLSDLIEFSKTHSAGETLFRFTEKVGVYENLLKQGTIEAEEKIMNIATFFGKIHQFERENDEVTVIDFIDYLDMAEEAGENPSAKFEIEGGEGVQISTIHGVKGLEFHTVFVTNLVNRRFPSDNRKDPIGLPDELIHEILTEKEFHEEEERRLFYVACTRAKEKLYLLHSNFYAQSTSKNPRVQKRSRFIDEVIEEVSITELTKTQEGVEKVLRKKEPVPFIIEPQKQKITQFSYTQLSTFERCPRQYEYNNILRIPEPMSSSESFGSTLHNTLLEFYRLVMQSKEARLFEEYKEDLSLKRLLSIYDQKWIGIGYESKEHMEARRIRGKEILEKFYEHFKEGTEAIEFLEKKFKVKVGDYTLSGRIDRADKLADGTLEIIDYKTGKAKDQEKVDKDEQLMIYALAAAEAFDKPASKLTLYFLDEDLRVSTEPDAKKLDKLKEGIIETCDKINASDFAPTPSKFKCPHCPFRKICDAAML